VHKRTFLSKVRTSMSLSKRGREAYRGHLAALRAINGIGATPATGHRRHGDADLRAGDVAVSPVPFS
jgi:hypothetical protein